MYKTISIEGMHCQHCSAAVTKALESLPGTSNVAVSLEKGQAQLETGTNSDAALREAIEDIGFDVTAIK
jgi:copper chaperone